MMDVEFSHPMKALGEIFEIGARPFRVGVVDEKSTTSIDLSAGVMMYKEQIEPSLEYGAAEFYFMTIEVRLQRCVALFFVIASPPPIVFLNLLPKLLTFFLLPTPYDHRPRRRNEPT